MSHETELLLSEPIAKSEAGQLQARRTHDLDGGDVVSVRVEVENLDGSKTALYLDVPLAVWLDVARD